MQTIGDRLRQARERLGLTLEEAERTTRIRTQHLDALERGEFDRLPSPVQLRGFLRNYADYLGLDSDRLLRELQGNGADRPTTRPRKTTPPAAVPVRRASWFSTDLLVAAVIALGTLALLVWGGGRAMASLRAAAAPAGESSALLIPTATASNTPPAAGTAPATAATQPPTAAPTLPPVVIPAGQVNVRLLVVQRAWVRALSDGRQRYAGRVEPGAILDLSATTVVEVTTGNGAAFRVSWNGQDQGLLGGLDEVVTRLWTIDGAITPTPTASPTPTITSPPSATPRTTATSAAGG
jgi:transcriptional regulator with XRE-family HTH domain